MSVTSKNFRSYEEQVDLLIARGMRIADKSEGANHLERINYYRLSGYWYPFRQRDQNGKRLDSFIPGTTLDDVLQVYEFDSRLRIATFASLSDIELWLRANLGYSLGQVDSHAHLSPSILNVNSSRTSSTYQTWVKKYQRELSKSKEDFVKHHHRKYGGKLPVWVAVEILDWGALSHLYGFSPQLIQQAIADSCALSVPQMQSFLRTLNAVRNTAAHHGRLFNRAHALRPKLPAVGVSKTLDAVRLESNRTFALLSLIQYLRTVMGLKPSSMLIKAFEAYPKDIQHLPLNVTGAPQNWADLDLWKRR